MLRNIITDSIISREVDKTIDNIESGLLEMLVQVGNICLKDMDKNKGYRDVSHNLSDSRGFVVVKNKSIFYQSDFKSTLGGQEGKRLSQEKALSSNGISLIVVAGMKYAEHVEATGKNVYTSAELLAESIVPKLLRQIFK